MKVDETLNLRVIEFNKDFKRVVMSHAAVYKGVEADNVKTARRKMSESAEKSTLGDLDALADLKRRMDGDA